MPGVRAACSYITQAQPAKSPALPLGRQPRGDADESVVISHNWDELRRFAVGLRRHSAHQQAVGARGAPHRALLKGEIHEFYAHFHVTRDLLELRNLVQVADLIVQKRPDAP